MTATERAQTLDALKPYPAYKHSGVEWVGDIPQSWDMLKIKQICNLENGFVFPPDSWTTEGTPIIRIENFTNKEKFNYSQLHVPLKHHVQHGSLLFSWSASLGPHIWDSPGTFYLNQHIFRVDTDRHQKWLYYALESATEHLKNHMHGSAMTHITRSKLDNMVLPEPPSTEQTAIAAFLDHETARIDALVHEQEQLLEDLAEKRRSTITAAVTAGIRPQLTQRTDIPWMPLIPQHWKVIPLKHLLKSLDQGWSPECENRQAEPGEWGVLKLSAVTSGRFLPEEHKTLPADEDPDPRLTLQAGDVLVTRANTRSLVGATALVAADQTMLMMSDLIYRLRTIPDLYSPAFLTAVLQSAVGRAVIELNANGTSHSMVKIPQRVLLNMPVPVPPRQEQDEIIEHIDHVLAQINDLVAEVRANIEDMKLLRSTLITAATTGKIDVRGWSPA